MRRRHQQRVMVTADYYDYFCRYSLSQDEAVLVLSHHRYTPANLPTIFPLNQPIIVPLQWVNRERFVIFDNGVPTRYVRRK